MLAITQSTDANRPRCCQRLICMIRFPGAGSAGSFRSFPNDIDDIAPRRTNGQCQLISRYRDKALLFGAVPVWKRAAFDVDRDVAICLVCRIGPEVGYRAVGGFPVFLSCALPQGIAGVFGA